MLGPNLATCQLGTWAENAVKFELKLTQKANKNEVGVEWETRKWHGMWEV